MNTSPVSVHPAPTLGAEAGFTVDEIDDVRLALDEVFSMLAERHVGERVRTTFRLDGRQLIAGLTLESGPVDVEPDELAPTSCVPWSTTTSSTATA